MTPLTPYGPNMQLLLISFKWHNFFGNEIPSFDCIPKCCQTDKNCQPHHYMPCSLPFTLYCLAMIMCKLIGYTDVNTGSATVYTVLIHTLNLAVNPILVHFTIFPVRTATWQLLAKFKGQRVTQLEQTTEQKIAQYVSSLESISEACLVYEGVHYEINSN